MKKNIAIIITRLDLGGAQKATEYIKTFIIEKVQSLRDCEAGEAIPAFNGVNN
jgi:hypothetical protein